MAKLSKTEDTEGKPFTLCKFAQILVITWLLIKLFVVLTVIVLWLMPVKLTPVITISDGQIQGSIGYSRNDSEFWQFLGIPYAKATTGHRKFTPPEQVEPWDLVKQVTSYPAGCAQFDALLFVRPQGQLDCLYLNVFVNVANGGLNSSKPVLVWIHGGGFISGGAYLYHPEYFMDHDVVLVSINYRLGPYGFLNLEDSENGPPGNVGLLDQNMALQWIQRNIASFGGDPNRVTLFGESAGAVSTALHVLSKKSKNLVHRAVAISGNALAPWSFSKHPRKIANYFAEKNNCKDKSSKEIYKCFKSADWNKLVDHQHCLLDPILANDLYRPSVDDNFLSTSPENILKQGDFPNIPIMFGVNGGEGVLRSARFEAMPEQIEKADKNWAELVGGILLLETPPSKEIALKIREQYFGDLCFSDNPEAFKRNLTELFSDIAFFYGAHKSAKYHAEKGAPVYMYYFNYTSKVFTSSQSMLKSVRLDDWLPGEVKMGWAVVTDWLSNNIFWGPGSRPYGIGHGEDLFQLWNILGVTQWASWLDLNFSQGFIKAIVDFANATSPLTYRNIVWPTINNYQNSGKHFPYMLMDNQQTAQVISEPFSERLKFWENLLDEQY